jgi:hypothetical protein
MQGGAKRREKRREERREKREGGKEKGKGARARADFFLACGAGAFLNFQGKCGVWVYV